MRKNDESLWASWDTIKTNIPYNTGVTEEEREKAVENVFKEIMAKNFPNLGRNLDIQLVKLIGHPKISIQNDSSGHIIVKQSKVKDK